MLQTIPDEQVKTRPSLHIEFYVKPIYQKRASAEEGRPIYADKEYVRIRFPGDPKRVIDAPANDKPVVDKATGRRLTYAEVYHQHYAIFKAGHAEQIIGTPLAELPFLTASKREELRHLQVHTAEQLAGISDTTLQRLGMGARALRDQAQAYLDRAAATAGQTTLAAQNAELQERIARLERMLQDQERPPAPVDHAPDAAADHPPAQGQTTDEDEAGADEAGADFENWAEEDLRAFLADQTGKPADGRWKMPKLIEEAYRVYREKRAAVEAAERASPGRAA